MRLPSSTAQAAGDPSSCTSSDHKDDEAAVSAKNGGKEVQANMREVDYSEYEWMEHIEEFDKEVIRELEEQAFYEQCFIEASEGSEEGYCDIDDLEEYDEEEFELQIASCMPTGDEVMRSPLNPSAPEFIPKSFPTDGGETMDG